MRGIHGQRGQDREDLLREHRAQLRLGGLDRVPPSAPGGCARKPGPAGSGPRRRGRAGACSLWAASLIWSSTSHGAEPGRGGDRQPGGDAPLQPGHPDHEELVQVGGEDGQEIDPLQQVQVRVLGELQHPGVEGQPAQLSVQEAVRGDVPLRHQVRGEFGDVDPVLGGAGGLDFGGSEAFGAQCGGNAGGSGGFRFHSGSLQIDGSASTLLVIPSPSRSSACLRRRNSLRVSRARRRT